MGDTEGSAADGEASDATSRRHAAAAAAAMGDTQVDVMGGEAGDAIGGHTTPAPVAAAGGGGLDVKGADGEANDPAQSLQGGDGDDDDSAGSQVVDQRPAHRPSGLSLDAEEFHPRYTPPRSEYSPPRSEPAIASPPLGTPYVFYPVGSYGHVPGFDPNAYAMPPPNFNPNAYGRPPQYMQPVIHHQYTPPGGHHQYMPPADTTRSYSGSKLQRRGHRHSTATTSGGQHSTATTTSAGQGSAAAAAVRKSPPKFSPDQGGSAAAAAVENSPPKFSADQDGSAAAAAGENSPPKFSAGPGSAAAASDGKSPLEFSASQGSAAATADGNSPPEFSASQGSPAAGGSSLPKFHFNSPNRCKDELDPRNLPIQRKAYREVAAPRVNRAPPLKSTAPESSFATSRPSFASMARKKTATCADSDDLTTSLLEYMEKDDEIKKQVATARLRLTLDFKDIYCKNKDLATRLCTEQGTNDFLLREAANSFFFANGVDTQKASIKFKNMPTRIWSAIDYLKSENLYKNVRLGPGPRGERTVDVATAHGRRTLDCILSSALDRLALGESWGGTLSSDDLTLAEYKNGVMKLLITKTPLIMGGASDDDRLDDLWAIWRAIIPSYVIGDGKLPLYFKRLQRDLYEAVDIEDWFFEYLRYHPALFASIPRKNLIENIQSVFKTSKMAHNKDFDFVFKSNPLSSSDWRIKARTSAILNGVLTFKDNKKKKKKKGKVGEVAPVYEKSIAQLLLFHRNGTQHPEGRVLANGDEMELLLAVVFEDFLPELIGCILRLCGMGDDFADGWSIYKFCKPLVLEPPVINAQRSSAA